MAFGLISLGFMKILISLLLLLWASSLSADVYSISYTLKLDESFLLGNDSVNLVLHNGRFLKKLKLKRGTDLEIDMEYLIPCFSGRRLSVAEQNDETLEWNGSTYNFYYEDSRQMISVPAITTDIRMVPLRSDSTYSLSLDATAITDFEQAQFRRLYYDFVSMSAVVAQSGIQTVLEGVNSKFRNVIYGYLNLIRFDNFTVKEVESLFKLDLPDTGTVTLNRYYDGKVIGKVKIITTSGYLKAVRY